MKVLVAQNDEICPLGSLGAPLRNQGIELVTWRAWDRPPPASLAGFEAVIGLGGGQNPDEDTRCPWLEPERRVLHQALAADLPILGICLGAQLLAQVLGAWVGRLKIPEIGWRELSQGSWDINDRLWRRLPERLQVFEWHSYGFGLPHDANLLAGSPRQAEAFRFGDHAWAVQFHIEADAPIIGNWISRYRHVLHDHGISAQGLWQETIRRRHAYAELARAVAEGFVEAIAAANSEPERNNA